jgi:hypothetical protein
MIDADLSPLQTSLVVRPAWFQFSAARKNGRRNDGQR